MSTIHRNCNKNEMNDEFKRMNDSKRDIFKVNSINKSFKDISKEKEITANYVKEENFNTRIDSLDDYFLVNLFSFLNVREKLSIERVCKRWQTIIREMLTKEAGLGTTWTSDKDWNCLQSTREHCVSGGDIREAILMSNGWFYDLTHHKSINNLQFISHKCPNIKCLHISHCIIDSNCLQKLMDFYPEVECIHLKSNILKGVVTDSNYRQSAHEWNEIGKVLGPLIRHLSLDPHYEHRMNENDAKQLIQHFKILEEFRVGTHFDREVVGKFVSHLTKNCKLFYSLGREFSMEALMSLKQNQKQSLTHLTYFSSALSTVNALKSIGETFTNLVRLKINLSFNETILTSPSPISKLANLQEFSLDLNNFSDNHVDDGLIWCIKDGLPLVKVLEISRACISVRAFNSIEWCLPQLSQLVFTTVEIQCRCESEVRDRSERYCCANCKKKCWSSISNLKYLKELVLSNNYFRGDKPKPFHSELCQLLPTFKSLRLLSIFQYNISSVPLFEALEELMKSSDSSSYGLNNTNISQNNDLFVLKLKSIPNESFKSKISKKICVIHESFM